MSSPALKIAVQDANILIDLELSGLFDAWFQAGIETHTTDLIRAELEKGRHAQALSYFKSGQVIEHSLSYDQLLAVAQLEQEVGNKAVFNDCSVLYLAIQLDATLLSGDKPLRKAGEERRIEVHGTLWILDQLVELKILTKQVAILKLETLRSMGRFLPVTASNTRLKKWSSS